MLSKMIAILLFLASVQAVEYTPATSYSSINRYGASTKELPATYQTAPALAIKPLALQTGPAVTTYQAIKPLAYQDIKPLAIQTAPAVTTYQALKPQFTTAYHSAPATTYHSTPVTTYHATPVATYHSAPAATYHSSSPVTTYHSAPTTTYHSAPVTTYHTSPVTTYHSAPVAAPVTTYHSSPVASPVTTYHSSPVASPVTTYHSSPVATYHTSPVTTFHASPVTTFHSAPVAHVHSVDTLLKPTQLTSLHTSPAVTTVLSKPTLVEQSQYPAGRYEFEYGVQDQHTGDVKRQHEIGDGGVVKGEYSLLQPDGITRTVTYAADEHSGFNAKVEYSGHSTHPVSKPEIVKTLALH